MFFCLADKMLSKIAVDFLFDLIYLQIGDVLLDDSWNDVLCVGCK